MTAFQHTSVCSFSPFLSVISANNNVLIYFLPSHVYIVSLQIADVPFILKEEVSLSLTSFPTTSFFFSASWFCQPISCLTQGFCSLAFTLIPSAKSVSSYLTDLSSGCDVVAHVPQGKACKRLAKETVSVTEVTCVDACSCSSR